MGSYIELNDTLQITKAQGFPDELNIKEHLKSPYALKEFKNKIFEFKDKPEIRIFHAPPVRVFFVQNIEGVWLYWGWIQIQELTLDTVSKTTSGKYKIIKIFTPEEMRKAEKIIHNAKNKTYFSQLPLIIV